MKLATTLALVATALLLTACASAPEQATDQGSVIQTNKDGSKIENRSDYAEYTRTKSELAGKPLFEMTCPPTGCLVTSLKVNNPMAAADIQPPAPPPKVESAAVGVAREVKETVLGSLPFALGFKVTDGFKSMFSDGVKSNVGIAGRTQQPASNNTFSVSGPNSALAVGGSANSTGPMTNTSTTTSSNTSTATTTTTNTTTNNTTSTQTNTGSTGNNNR